MTWLVHLLLERFLLTPWPWVAGAFWGASLRWMRPGLGAALLGGSLFVLYLLTIPLPGVLLLAPLEAPFAALSTEALQSVEADAIVVLGGGRRPAAREYDEDDVVNHSSLTRIHMAAHLYRRTALPVLLSGGSPMDEPVSEAALMAKTLEGDFQVPVRWQEGKSRNTWENAVFSKRMLEPHGVGRILLVTQAYHMLRARWCFEEAGFEVVAVPTEFMVGQEWDYLSLLWPRMMTGEKMMLATHEWLGLGWYRLRYLLWPVLEARLSQWERGLSRFLTKQHNPLTFNMLPLK
ncbi:MAG: YdcF family protein [Magnetococcales bacterium]|nr:YdcF family protein [Magnetococcales bacterium]